MSKNKPNIDLHIEQMKALTWDDIILVPSPDYAEKISSHALIGKLVSTKVLNKHNFPSTIRAVWSFVPGLTIEDLGTNTFLFTFPSPTKKSGVFQ